MVSILVPVFNREDLLLETLVSIQKQSYSNWECILVDDGSNDSSLSICKEMENRDSRFRAFSRPVQTIKGAAACRNYAFENSRGEFIQYFDSDDKMLPFMLERKVEKLSRYPKADFLVSKMASFDADGRIDHQDYPLTSTNLIADFLTYQVYFLTPGPMFRKVFLEKFQVKFDEILDRRQEREFYTRIVLSEPVYITSDEVHCLRRIHGNSIKSTFETKSSTIQVWSKFLFYRQLFLNSQQKYGTLMNQYFGDEVTRMIFFFLKKGKLGRAWEVLQFRISIG